MEIRLLGFVSSGSSNSADTYVQFKCVTGIYKYYVYVYLFAFFFGKFYIYMIINWREHCGNEIKSSK